MSLLERHLEQISLSSESLASLPFPSPNIFTNALLRTLDITSLIRDTEPHERALFSVPPAQATVTASTPYIDPKSSSSTSRRQTVFNVAQGEVTTGNTVGNRAPRRHTAVAAVLGAELEREVRKTEGKGDVDVEVLLKGAERLNGVYSVHGVPERIRSLTERYGDIRGSLDFYERKVERQTRELENVNRGNAFDKEDWEDEDAEESGRVAAEEMVTDEDLRREEEEIRELEGKKRDLEDRISGMERDLGGLLR